MLEEFIEVHTDGSCKPNPGPGGWGVVILYPGGGERYISGFVEPGYWVNDGGSTSNNKLEVTAVIEALKTIPMGSKVKVYTDSTYVLGAMGWDGKNNRPLPKKNKRNINHDILERLDQLVEERNVSWEHEAAHVGNKYNEMADKLANNAVDARGGIDERKN